MIPRTIGRLLAALALSGLWLLLGCQPELLPAPPPTTAYSWLQASARVHDPAGLWPGLRATFRVDSHWPDGTFGSREELALDFVADTFRRETMEGEYRLVKRLSARNPQGRPTLLF